MNDCLQLLQIKQQMKGKKPLERPQSFKVLQGEAEKLKDKLEGLKQQIKAKKQEKELSKTMHPMGYSTKQPIVTTATTQKDDSLFKLALTQIKIQAVEQKLRDRGITNIQSLIACSEEDIDQWKDIPVGYRIKLKKHIQKDKQNSGPALNIISNEPEPKEFKKQKEMDIQQIIKHRKALQKFVPLTRKTEEEAEEEQQLEQEDQEKMMLSILEVISVKQRTSCIKKKSKTKKQKYVHWSPTVEEMEKDHKVKTYPKQIVSKEVFHMKEPQKESEHIKTEKNQGFHKKKEQLNNYRYCWSCLKRITGTSHFSKSQRCFCSLQCQISYQEVVNPVDLLRKMEETEDKYNQCIVSALKRDYEQIDLQFQ